MYRRPSPFEKFVSTHAASFAGMLTADLAWYVSQCVLPFSGTIGPSPELVNSVTNSIALADIVALLIYMGCRWVLTEPTGRDEP